MSYSRKLFAVVLLMLCSVAAKAHFTIVDADDRQPLQGVYVFSDTGKLLAMSDDKGQVQGVSGKVMLSLLSYEGKTIDATDFQGEVALKEKTIDLPDVVIGKTEYVKISAAFRDVVKNFDNLVVYREGIVDYYYNVKSRKYTRRIRACRQLEHPDLRKPEKDSVVMMALPLLDFNKVGKVTSLSDSVKGDTTIVEASYGKKSVKDGIIMIENNGTYREIVDAVKFLEKTSVNMLGIHYTLKKHLIDWQFNDKEVRTAENLVSCRDYREESYQWSKKSPVVPIFTTSDLVVFSITYPKKEDAREEMKDKDIDTTFTLPDCLPAVPESIVEASKKLVQKKFRER